MELLYFGKEVGTLKRIGIIGGMSYESTLHYYEAINRQVNERAGGLVSADLVLRSVNFEEYHKLMEVGDWEEIAHKLSFEALDLVLKNNCDYVAIATNTMHKVASEVIGPHEVVNGAVWPHVSSWVDIPLVHIGDCIGEKCKATGARTVLLLGTKHTMCDEFMIDFLRTNYGLDALNDLVDSNEVQEVHRIIFEELCHGKIVAKSEEFLTELIRDISFECMEQGLSPSLDAVILGCTELNMILDPDNLDIPLIDSTQAHIDKLVDLCLEN